MKAQLIIQGDTDAGTVSVNGPIDNMLIVYWLLNEARRLCEKRANKRDEAGGNSGIVVVKGNIKS